MTAQPIPVLFRTETAITTRYTWPIRPFASFCTDFLRGRESATVYRLANQTGSRALSAIGYDELYHGALKQGRDPVLIDATLPSVVYPEYDRTDALEGARIRQERNDERQRSSIRR